MKLDINQCLVYDIEIIKAVPAGGPLIDGVEYCAGWDDHENMGISVIGAYDFFYQQYRVFMADNFHLFRDLLKHRVGVGYNNINFDNKVLAHHDLLPDGVQYVDLLRAIWKGAGHDPDVFNQETHSGYGLDAMARANLGASKTGHGAVAPVDWQKGRIGSVIDYCLNDVRLTARLFEKAYTEWYLKTPARDTLRVDLGQSFMGPSSET